MKSAVVTALAMTSSVAAFLVPVSKHLGSPQVIREYWGRGRGLGEEKDDG